MKCQPGKSENEMNYLKKKKRNHGEKHAYLSENSKQQGTGLQVQKKKPLNKTQI